MVTRHEYVAFAVSHRGAYGPGQGLRNNDNKFNTWYYGRRVSGDDYAWCEVIEKYFDNHFGILAINGGKSAFVPAMVNIAHTVGAKVWHRPTSVPADGTSWAQPGNKIVYAFTSGSSGSHTGIYIKRLSSTTIRAFEGNTESDLGSDVADYKDRSVHNILYVIELLGVSGSSKEDDDMAKLEYVSLGMSKPQTVTAGSTPHGVFDIEYGDAGDAHAGDGKGVKKDAYPGILSGGPKKTSIWLEVETTGEGSVQPVETDPKHDYAITKKYPTQKIRPGEPLQWLGKVETGQHLYVILKPTGDTKEMNVAVKCHYVHG